MATFPSLISLRRRLIAATASYDLVLTPIALVGGVIASFGLVADGHLVRGYALAVACFLAVVFGLLKAVASLRQQLSEQPNPREMEGCLHTIHALLTAPELMPEADGNDSEPSDPSLRLTLHQVVNDGNELVQALDYVGANRSHRRTAGRIFPATCGIIGKALRERQPQFGQRLTDDDDAYIEELIKFWSYTEQMALQVNRESMSWMAIPIFDKDLPQQPVLAVLFLDSVDPDFFTESRRQIAQSASVGIAQFLSHRYS